MENINSKMVACYVYTECRSKNNQNSLNLVVKQHEIDNERCRVKILDRYL